MASSYRELIVWQRAVQLTVAVYGVTTKFPKEELFGLTSQMRRSAVSVASNIAEGYGRRSQGEYLHFLGIARGSNLELQTQIVIAHELKFGDRATLDGAEQLSFEVGKMPTSLMRKLER